MCSRRARRAASLQLALTGGRDLLEDGEALEHPALELGTHARGRHPVEAVDLRLDLLGALAPPLLDEL